MATYGTDPVQDVIGLGVLVIAWIGLRNGKRSSTTNKMLTDQNVKISEVHELVNAQLSDQTTRADDALIENAALRKSAADNQSPSVPTSPGGTSITP